MNFAEFQERLNKEIHQLEFPGEPRELYDPAKYIISLGGKRLRPMLVLLGCELAGGNIEDAIKPALGIELFHNFTLMHDDIMDQAPLRRGNPTVHTKWNTNIAILSGDLLFTMASRMVAEAPHSILREVLDVFYLNAARVCEGQQWDMNFEQVTNPSIDEYIMMIRLKTAVLLGASLQIGALCGGATMEEAQKLYEAGCSLGISFQLQDDMLDVYGTSDSIGKRKGGDILSNKKTFLKLKAMEKADPNQKKALLNWYSSQDFENQEKINSVTGIFDKLEIKEETEKLSGFYFNQGMEMIRALSFRQEKKVFLTDFLMTLVDRTY
jgi:geranylgeranyl diphosphate synthase type II